MKTLKVPTNTPWKVQWLVAIITFNTQEEALAIAELIAAAPELLEATLGLSKLVAR